MKLRVPQPCALDTQRKAAAAGTLGSLCTPTRSYVGGGPTLCQSGSYCRLFLNGSLANTGVGFCAANPSSGSAAPSPFAGYLTATRNDAAFDPCRLPLVYQGAPPRCLLLPS